MGKLVRIDRLPLEKLDSKDESSNKAVNLIREAVGLLRENGSNIPWILEDCIELLHKNRGDDLGVTTRSDQGNENSGLDPNNRDPRMILNCFGEPGSIVKKKK